MPVLGSFLRISTRPEVMKNMELPGCAFADDDWLGREVAALHALDHLLAFVGRRAR